MGNYILPDVYSKEIDSSNLIPALSTTSAALVGGSPRGQVGVKFISDGAEFIAEYGKPVPGNYFHYTALAFLAQGNQLYCRRVVKTDCLYGGICVNKTGTTPVAIVLSAGVTDPTIIPETYSNAAFFIFGKNPGVWNNQISIKVAANVQDASWFDIQVYYTEAGVTRLVETWTISRVAQVDGYGNQIYLETRINGFSDYIVVKDNTVLAAATVPAVVSTALAMDKGADGTAVGDSEVVAGWSSFENPNEVDIRILLNGGFATSAVQTAMKNIAEARLDCIAILDVPYAARASAASMITFRSSTQNFNSSYVALYGPWIKVYDQYNDGVMEIPASGYVGAVYAYNDYAGNIWTAPAGFNRGLLPVQGVSVILSDAAAATLVAVQINPIMFFKGEGIAVWGQDTEQVKSSALSNVNVRRLLIIIEKAIKISLRSFLFESNNVTTRLRVSAMIEEYLGALSAQGAFQTEGGDRGYMVLCNERNNSSATIDAGELHVKIYIKPVRVAKYIVLNTVITQTGASFEEMISRGIIG
jgi:phage tail sheath protein FI